MSELKPKDKSTQGLSENTLQKVLRNEIQKREGKNKMVYYFSQATPEPAH